MQSEVSVYRVHTDFERHNSRIFQGLLFSMTIFVLFKDLKKRKKKTPPPKMQAFTRTQKEIGGVVFIADATIFTTRNIPLTAGVGAHTHTRIHTTLVAVFSSKFI